MEGEEGAVRPGVLGPAALGSGGLRGSCPRGASRASPGREVWAEGGRPPAESHSSAPPSPQPVLTSPFVDSWGN